MSQVLSIHYAAGSNTSNDPRPIGDIITEMLHSDSPLAKGFRSHQALKEINAEKGVIEHE